MSVWIQWFVGLRVLTVKCHVTECSLCVRQDAVTVSDDMGRPLLDFERAAETLDAGRHLVRWSEIQKEHVVRFPLDHLFEAGRQFDSPPCRKATLEDGQLQTIPKAFDDCEHTTPSSSVGYVVGNDEQALFGHRSAGNVMGNGWDLSKEMAGEKTALDGENATHTDTVSEDRMGCFLIKAAFPGRDEGLPA